jgi:hypothetical protein
MSSTTSNIWPDVTIRWALPTDRKALERVAGLDSKRLPAGELLVAAVDGRIWAAFSTLDGAFVADPFVPSGDLVGLLRTRASQVAPATRLPQRVAERYLRWAQVSGWRSSNSGNVVGG